MSESEIDVNGIAMRSRFAKETAKRLRGTRNSFEHGIAIAFELAQKIGAGWKLLGQPVREALVADAVFRRVRTDLRGGLFLDDPDDIEKLLLAARLALQLTSEGDVGLLSRQGDTWSVEGCNP